MFDELICAVDFSQLFNERLVLVFSLYVQRFILLFSLEMSFNVLSGVSMFIVQ